MASMVTDYRRRLHEMAQSMAEKAYVAYCRNLYQEQYLVGVREEDGCYSGIRVAAVLADNETPIVAGRVPTDKTVPALADWIHTHLRRTPLAFIRDLDR